MLAALHLGIFSSSLFFPIFHNQNFVIFFLIY